ncbi:MAG: heme exporter protein CcmD [Pseudomonadota bacterium]
MTGFFEMGGYAAYVWPAWGLSAVLLAALALISLQDYKRAKRAADALKNEDAP